MNKHDYTSEDKVAILSDNHFTNKKLTLNRFKNRCGLLVVYAPWCKYCKELAPIIKFLGKQLKSHTFQIGVLNGDANPTTIQALRVRSYPTLFWTHHDGKLEEYSESKRDMESILQGICRHSQSLLVKKWQSNSAGTKNSTQRPQKKKKKKIIHTGLNCTAKTVMW